MSEELRAEDKRLIKLLRIPINEAFHMDRLSETCLAAARRLEELTAEHPADDAERCCPHCGKRLKLRNDPES